MFNIYLLLFNILMLSVLIVHNGLSIHEINNKSREASLVEGDHADLNLYLLKREMRVCFVWGAIFVGFFLFFLANLMSVLV